MTSMLLVFVALGGAGQPETKQVQQQVIDDFAYGDTIAARKQWAPTGAPAIEWVQDNHRSAIRLEAPFASKPTLDRVYIDRAVKVDLAAPGEFVLSLSAPEPSCVAHLSLYFHSGDGWFGAGTGLQKRGWQTVRFSKASFKPEGKPAGWGQIEGIRIAVWRGSAKDSHMLIGSLAARWHNVAVVVPEVPDEGAQGDVMAGLEAAKRVSEMLADLGLGADAIDEASLAKGALANRRVAVLAYNPRLSSEGAAVLTRFVEDGGRVLACYGMPPGLEKALGFGHTQYVRPEQPDKFAEIRFDAADVPGLPRSVRQASWNITAAEPLGQNARIIGKWYDSEGKATGLPAMLLSDHGAFFSHVILSDDLPGKKQMLAAVLGKLCPALWPEMVQAQTDRNGVGHLADQAETAAYITASRVPAAQERLAKSEKQAGEARQSIERGEYPRAIEQLRQARSLLAEAYLRAMPSKSPEGRAFWNHSGTGAYPGDWERTAKELADAHFNMVIPNLLWAGVAHYASDVLPRSKTFDQYGDQVAQCVKACRRHGIEVHAWKVNHNLSGAPKEFVDKLRREGRTQVSPDGKPLDWLCPSHPKNFALERDSMLEVARKYEVDGLHFDYIRYPDGDHCYCDGCRRRFEADSGRAVAHWPADCYSGSRRAEYRDWRCRQISRLVETVHREAKQIRPGIKISAAVFGNYPSCRESVGQDWVAWIKAGWLDFVCPMDYTESDLSFGAMVAGQLEFIGGRIPMYPGIGATASSSGLSADRVAGQIHLARAAGAAGFTIFNLDRGTIESLPPNLVLGPTAGAAKPPKP
jgi:uncharacterized lipoprotein YddW (UPF0748 family)